MTDTPRTPPAALRSTLAMAIFVLAVLVWALPREIQPGDAGEFATVMLRGGIPHPSGYPWMRVLGLPARALWALGVPPATAAALPCALLGAAGLLLLHRVAGHLARPASPRGRAVIATLSTGLIASAPPMVLHLYDAEVWGPLIFAAGGFTWLALVRRARPWVLGLALGLAVSHHLTAILMLPLAVGAAWPETATPKAVLRAGIAGLGGSGLGLSVLLTLMLGAHGSDAAWAWGDTASLPGWLHHVTRGDYGVFELSLHNQRPPAWAQLRRAWQVQGGALSAQLSPHWVLSGIVVLLPCALVLRRGALPRRLRLGLVGSVVLSGTLFPTVHNLDPTSPFGGWILERFDLLPLALLIPVVAMALTPLPAAVQGRGRAGLGLAIAGGLLILRQLVFTAWHGTPSDNPWVQTYALDVLRTPEVPAVIVGTDDHRTFPLLYASEVLGERPDVLYIDASLLAHPWYRARLRSRAQALPPLPDIDKPVRLLTALQADPAWDDVPLYLTNDFSRHSVGLERVPEGVLWRLEHPTGASSPDEVLARHERALARYGPLVRTPFIDGHPFAADLLTNYLQTTKTLSEALYAQGRDEDAEALLRYAIDPQ